MHIVTHVLRSLSRSAVVEISIRRCCEAIGWQARARWDLRSGG